MSSWTEADIPDQTGRVAVVTGANSGIGFEAVRALAKRGASVILAVRNLEKGEAAVAKIRAAQASADLEVQQLDLASLDSIRTAAEAVKTRRDRIDLLINNAGVMFTPRQKTVDGFEMQFGTNHLGHFAWTGLMIDRMMAVPGSRVVTVSSAAHQISRGINFSDLHADRRYGRVTAYSQSKLANLLFVYELQRRLSDAGVETVALGAHPGGANTNLSRHVPRLQFMLRFTTQDAAMGALPTLRAATDPDARGGQYYGPDGFLGQQGHPIAVTSSRQSHDSEAQFRLWDVSEALTGVTFPLHQPGAENDPA